MNPTHPTDLTYPTQIPVGARVGYVGCVKCVGLKVTSPTTLRENRFRHSMSPPANNQGRKSLTMRPSSLQWPSCTGASKKMRKEIQTR